MRKRATSTILLLALSALWPATATAASIPDWLRALAQQSAKHYADDVNGVILLDSTETTIRDDGEIIDHRRLAFRILRPEGKDYAVLAVNYDSESKVNYLHGWSITAHGQEYELKDKDLLEASATSFEVYSDEKVKIAKVPGADVGTVVGFEYEKKKRPYIFQHFWDFQGEIPVEHAHYELHLPPSWEYRADWINHPDQAPAQQGQTSVWELTDIPRIEHEYRRPAEEALAGRMVISFFSEKIRDQTYKNWLDFGLWYTRLASGTRDATPPIQQKVQELAPSNLPVFDRISKLARFAQQDVRYAEISIGIGGWRPHSAAETFAHRYGDCKDKATVLSAMLTQIGIRSYYLLVNTERGLFTEKSPPQAYFDHMILAIALPDGVSLQTMPAIYEHPKLGHLLIFDPTNTSVPLGQIPFYEQDSFGLLVTDKGGELIHLPLSKPELNRIVRTAKLNLLPDGTLKGEIEEVRTGYHATMERAYLRDESQNDRKKTIEHFLGANLSSFQVDSFELVNADDIDKDLILRFKFTADHYAKTAGPLLLVRPRVVGEDAGYFDPAKPRHYPYEFRAPFVDSDLVEITLPDGFKVDELPDPTKASFPFAEYTSKTEASGNTLKYTREYKMTTTLVPVDNMEQLKHLFSEIVSDEKSMAVLKRAN